MGNSASKGGMSFNKKETDELKEAITGPYAEALSRIFLIKKLYPENRMAYDAHIAFFLTVCSKHFDLAYFNSLGDAEKKGFLQCCRSGIENPDSGMGCYAMQPSDYDRFKPFFSKVGLFCGRLLFFSFARSLPTTTRCLPTASTSTTGASREWPACPRAACWISVLWVCPPCPCACAWVAISPTFLCPAP